MNRHFTNGFGYLTNLHDVSRTNLVVRYVKNYNSNCKNQNCTIQITLSKTALISTEEIPIKLSYRYYYSSTPMYLRKNEIVNSIGLIGQNNYFYTDLSKNEEGEISIVYSKGGSSIYAKIVSKDKEEKEFNWNGRIVLPKETDTLSGIDADKGRIKIKKEDTTNCENGCELYVNLKNNEVFNKDYTQRIH